MKHIVITRKTGYFYTKEEDNNSISIAHILNDMVYDEKRNAIMIKDIKECVKEGRIPIILTERIEHIRILKEQLEELDVPILVYKGNMGKRKRIEIENKIQEVDQKQSSRIILATSSSIGEGFDDSRLDTLFLTMPVSWKGRIIQYVGRLHREHQGKETVMVYDYLDSMRVLEKMYDRRLNGYKIAGYEVEEIESLIE